MPFGENSIFLHGSNRRGAAIESVADEQSFHGVGVIPQYLGGNDCIRVGVGERVIKPRLVG